MITLAKTFSREKPLLYFLLWNDSDRRGWKNFLDYDVKNNLFIVPPPGRKGSVWYPPEELAEVDVLLKNKLTEDSSFVALVVKTLDSNWKNLAPYLIHDKKIVTVKEFHEYYEWLVDWWSAMTTVFTVPDIKEVSDEVRALILKYRAASEKYTEKMSRLLTEFWDRRYPDLKEFSFCIAPSEVKDFSDIEKKEFVSKFRARVAGCVMLNEKIYPLRELDDLLLKNNLALEKQSVEANGEIKGRIAYKGIVTGKVKKILSFADMKDFKAGEVVVTEMTNPEYLPIMKIAAAVVTDEGGMTCHAAIACRELKIPCIVGTKIATQILNDGDLVEVDVDNGVVRILESNYLGRYEAGVTKKNNDTDKNDIPKFFANLKKFVTRPMAVQKDELSGLAWSVYKGVCVTIPLDGLSRTMYVDDAGTKCSHEKIINELSTFAGWKKHLQEYNFGIVEMSKIVKLANRAAKNNLKKNLSIYLQWLEIAKNFGKFLIAPTVIEQKLDPYCQKLLSEEFGASAAASAFAIISSPSRLNDFQKMRIKIDDFVISGKKDKKILKKLVDGYAWYSEYSYVEPLLDEKYFINEANKLNVKDAKKEKTQILEEVKRNKLAYSLLRKKFKNKELKLVAEVLFTYSFLRAERMDCFKKTQTSIRKIFYEIAQALSKKTGDSWTMVMVANCLNKELVDFVKNGLVPDLGEIKQRISGQYVYYFENDGSHIFYDKEKIEKVKAIIGQNELKNINIAGKVAFTGKAVGRVVIVQSKNDLSKVKEGDILVAITTMPDYTPAMRLAAAFVTDEGGIISHAAIIARELKKPCIVGTKNATSVLKNGDLVEVDADNGVVRIIK